MYLTIRKFQLYVVCQAARRWGPNVAECRFWRVKNVNQAQDTRLLENQPEKTFIGRVEKGVDFLGYQLQLGRLEVSAGSFRRFVEHALQLYEREQGRGGSPVSLGEYVRRWQQWAAAEVSEPVNADGDSPQAHKSGPEYANTVMGNIVPPH